MKIQNHRLLAGALTACFAFMGCGGDTGPSDPAGQVSGRSVASSGKTETALGAVPAEVVRAALLARPGLQISTSEYETRDGREYYDLGGSLPDGSALELDLTRVGGTWTVVEVQRDLALGAVPEPVQQALAEANPGWSPTRIIESDQGGGLVIYEFFGPGPDGGEAKTEVKWTGGTAEILVDEWLH